MQTRRRRRAAAAQEAPAGGGGPSATLLSLPLDAIEAIAGPLPLADRVRLTSCCRTLRQRAAASRGLWGDLDITVRLDDASDSDGEEEEEEEEEEAGREGRPARRASSLALWLAAHKGGLARLSLDMYIVEHRSRPAVAQRLLASMAGGALASLKLRYACGEASLSQLAQLPGLTCLQMEFCSLAALPPQLATLPLARLDVMFCEQLGAGGDAAFEPLAALGGSLRRLRCSQSGLERMPSALSALSALQELEIGLDASRGLRSRQQEPPPAHDCCRPLQQLTSLTKLKLSGGSVLTSLPRELSALTALKAADLAHLYYMQHDAAGAWAPLRHLQSLTWLALAAHGSLPAELAECTALVELDAGKRAPQASEAAWAPLARLTRLTKLIGCGSGMFAHLPASLLDLELAGELGGTSQEAFDGLGRAAALTRLHFGHGCGLRCVPRALSTLRALRELLLDANYSALGDADFAPLAALTALTRANLGDAQLAAVPSALSAATALVDLDLSGSKWAPTLPGHMIVHLELGHLSRLAPLTGVTRLVLWNTGTRRLPPELSTLRRLAWMALNQCSALGQGGDASFQPLSHLTALTELLLENTGLRAIPSQFSALTGLRKLDLTLNPGLARAGAAGWRALASLRGLREVKLSMCGFRAVPAPLAPLRASGTQFEIRYATEEEMYENEEVR